MENVGTNIEYASKIIKDGELVVFPTETVYGIGANCFDWKAVNKIFKAKKRPQDNPLIVHVNSIEMAETVAKDIGKIERMLMEKFWPGPLSIILNKRENIPMNVTAGLDTVSVRMPDNKFALGLIEKSNTPIAAPSANISGRPSGTCIEDIYDELKENVKYFIDGGISDIGIESTVVKVESEKIIILRPGKISKEDLQSICLNVEIDKNCFNQPSEKEKVLSPGMKHRHYSPKAKCVIFKLEDDKDISNLIRKIEKESLGKKVAIMCMNDIANIINKSQNIEVITLGTTLQDVSKNIFKSLRYLDRSKIDICYIQAINHNGIGLGIMNRLIRACEYNVIEI